MGRPKKSVVYKLDVSPLGDMATGTRGVGLKVMEQADKVRGAVHELDWKGDTASACTDRGDREYVQDRKAVEDGFNKLAQAYDDGKNAMGPMIDKLKADGQGFEADSFAVSEDWTVTDKFPYELAKTLAAGNEAILDRLAAIHTERANEAATGTATLQKLADELGTADEDTSKAIIDAKTSLAALVPSPAAVQEARLIPPQDPKAFTQWWNSLTEAQKQTVFARDQYIGNNDNMPTADRDRFNRLKLVDELGRASTAGKQVDALTTAHPDWAQGRNIPEPNHPGAIFKDRQDYEAWKRQFDDASGRAKYLPELQAIDKAVRDNPDRKLMVLDTQTGRQARVAVAVGDPDTADHIAVTTPGINTTATSITGMTDEAATLRRESLAQLSNTPGHQGESVATIAWIGYDPPQINDTQGGGQNAGGAWDVMHDDQARDGARSLARFYDGLGNTHQGPPADVTAIGHSYGSLTTGLALQEPGAHGITNAIFYGSPGIEATTPAQLGVQPGHVYTMETPNDPIQWVYDGPPLAELASLPLAPVIPIVPAGLIFGREVMGLGDFGPNPATNPNFTHLETGAVTTPDGRSLEAASGHSDYPRTANNGQPYTPGYNIAAVISGLGDQNAIKEK
ncbi:alpha/beta hydrolase [Mycobacterium sp. NPDC050853]|uniref:alpha/beta hydrolase n=1 Tax=Mycobacterium sp. NPDC050853 TaxID=3155160 RepID=UPI0033C82CA1